VKNKSKLREKSDEGLWTITHLEVRKVKARKRGVLKNKAEWGVKLIQIWFGSKS